MEAELPDRAGASRVVLALLVLEVQQEIGLSFRLPRPECDGVRIVGSGDVRLTVGLLKSSIMMIMMLL